VEAAVNHNTRGREQNVDYLRSCVSNRDFSLIHETHTTPFA